MSMTDAEDLSKSEVFSKVTKLLIPWATAAVHFEVRVQSPLQLLSAA